MLKNLIDIYGRWFRFELFITMLTIAIWFTITHISYLFIHFLPRKIKLPFVKYKHVDTSKSNQSI